MNTQPIPIFLAADDNYAPFVATTIASICAHTKSFVDFYVLDGGISEDSKNKIQALKTKYSNFSVQFTHIDVEKYFKNFLVNSYVSIATYYRFIIPDLFPNLSKVLYLDVDIIVLKDIKDFYNIDLGEYMLAAIEDQGDHDYLQILKENMDMKPTSPYFNAGVLLLDFDKWRSSNTTEKLFDIEKKYHGRLLCNDQDVLNHYFESKYKVLDAYYNSMTYNPDVFIRHYYGPIKPWHVAPNICTDEYDEFKLFWETAEETLFYEKLKNNCKYTTVHNLKFMKLYKKISEQKNKKMFAKYVHKEESNNEQ